MIRLPGQSRISGYLCCFTILIETASSRIRRALSKGQIGIIHAYASRQQRRQNNVVIAHELLHTFGATDKYDLSTLQPIYPQGYAEPERNPRLPQAMAEIMGGRTPIEANSSEIPDGLADTLIGPETAQEIGMLRTAANPHKN